VNPTLQQETDAVVGLIGRAKQVFGGDLPPVEPPVLGAAHDLEDHLGRGYF
jgi:hypothetical protein